MRRVLLVILDGVGIGALPDAETYGDEGADTLGNLLRSVDLRLPLLERLGLGNVLPLRGVSPVPAPQSMVGRLAPESVGKDTTVGHWEHMGLVTVKAFPTYPEGFPVEVIKAFSGLIGRGVLGNRPASGTAIIDELGAAHLASGRPIVYTSADSVFQVATHVDVVPLETLYEWCLAARGLLQGAHAVARVIARPFTGEPGAFRRTSDRRDFSLEPPHATYLDELAGAGVPVIALGKIGEVFTGRGIERTIKVASNGENLALIGELVRGQTAEASFDEGLLISNLGDFDTIWGHRNDASGFAAGLLETDRGLGKVVALLRAEDRILITADHGVDPTTLSTDHSREYVPILLYPRPRETPSAVYEGGFADTGAFVFEYLTGKDARLAGRSLARLRPARGWRRYTPVQAVGAGVVAGIPGRVGPEEAMIAGGWLLRTLGTAPETAIVLGSGLSLGSAKSVDAVVPYAEVPEWRVGTVPGHPQALAVRMFEGQRVAVLAGRIHEYEGFDLSETQLPVRSLAEWGVRRVILTTAAGAVDVRLKAGDVVIAGTVLDLQHPNRDRSPESLPGNTMDRSRAAQVMKGSGTAGTVGVHACVPGPQYETRAELAVLGHMGAMTVSMSPAPELRAALEKGLEVVVVAAVTNCGHTNHTEVLGAAARASERVAEVVQTLLKTGR